MGLDLNIASISGPGRLSRPLDYEVERPLNEADLAILATVPKGSVAPTLQRITDRHHSLARLLASGMPEAEAAIHTGYDISRISILKGDPAFQELQALYRKDARDQFISNLEHMGGLSRDAILELRRRIEDQPERFSVNELTRIATEMQDRVPLTDPLDTLAPELIELVAPDRLLPDQKADESGEAET